MARALLTEAIFTINYYILQLKVEKNKNKNKNFAYRKKIVFER
jgi:hypothetical protein